ncbi:hypothetical protein ES703_57243 [subsurface metagenome]
MIRKERRRQPLNQAEARSMNAASLQQIKKSPPKSSIVFNEKFKIFYDRKAKRIILGDEHFCRDTRRFKVLSAPQAIILKTLKNTLGKFKNSVTVSDLFFNLDDSWNEKMILSVLKILVKKRILEEEEIQDQKISVFRLR